MAKSVFRKAELQSPERVVRIEEVRADTMKVVYGTQAAEVSTADRQTAAQKIAEQFGIPEDTAKEIVEKAEEARKSAKAAPEEAEAAEKKNDPEREARQEAESDAPADEAPPKQPSNDANDENKSDDKTSAITTKDLASSIAAIPAPKKTEAPPSGFARWTNKSAKPLPNIPGLSEAIAANRGESTVKKPSIADFIRHD